MLPEGQFGRVRAQRAVGLRERGAAPIARDGVHKGIGFGGLGMPDAGDGQDEDALSGYGIFDYYHFSGGVLLPATPLLPAPEDRTAPLVTRDIVAIHDAPVDEIDCKVLEGPNNLEEVDELRAASNAG